MTEQEAIRLECERWLWEYENPDKPLIAFPQYKLISEMQGLSPLCEYYKINYKTREACKKCPIYAEYSRDCFDKMNPYHEHNWDEEDSATTEEEIATRKLIALKMKTACEKALEDNLDWKKMFEMLFKRQCPYNKKPGNGCENKRFDGLYVCGTIHLDKCWSRWWKDHKEMSK